MPSGPPPSRYRVVERGRRLEVIDTRAGSRAAPSLIPRSQPMRRADTGRRIAAALAGLARVAALGAADGQGRPLLTTAEWFDSRGPRTFVLDDTGQRRLATMLGIALAVMVFGWIVAGPFVLALPVIAGAVSSQHGKYLLARWFDGFTPAA